MAAVVILPTSPVGSRGGCRWGFSSCTVLSCCWSRARRMELSVIAPSNWCSYRPTCRPYNLMAQMLTAWVGSLQFVLGPVLTRVADVSAETGSFLTAGTPVLILLAIRARTGGGFRQQMILKLTRSANSSLLLPFCV